MVPYFFVFKKGTLTFLFSRNRDVPVRVRAVRVVTCCVLDSPVRVEFLRVACWICRFVLSRYRVACWVCRSVLLVACCPDGGRVDQSGRTNLAALTAH